MKIMKTLFKWILIKDIQGKNLWGFHLQNNRVFLAKSIVSHCLERHKVWWFFAIWLLIWYLNLFDTRNSQCWERIYISIHGNKTKNKVILTRDINLCFLSDAVNRLHIHANCITHDIGSHYSCGIKTHGLKNGVIFCPMYNTHPHFWLSFAWKRCELYATLR